MQTKYIVTFTAENESLIPAPLELEKMIFDKLLVENTSEKYKNVSFVDLDINIAPKNFDPLNKADFKRTFKRYIEELANNAAKQSWTQDHDRAYELYQLREMAIKLLCSVEDVIEDK